MVGSHRIIPTPPLQLQPGRRCLLMDRSVLEDMMGCRRVVHQPRRHAANPLLSSGAFGDYADAHGFQQPHVHHDVAADVYRMWVAA